MLQIQTNMRSAIHKRLESMNAQLETGTIDNIDEMKNEVSNLEYC